MAAGVPSWFLSTVLLYYYYFIVLLRHNGSKTYSSIHTHTAIHANTSTKNTKTVKTVKRNRTGETRATLGLLYFIQVRRTLNGTEHNWTAVSLKTRVDVSSSQVVQLLPQYGSRCAQLVPVDSVTLSGTRRAVVASPAQRRSRDSIILLTNSAPLTYDTIRYEMLF